MIEELVFTSARRGLQVGKSGFCTVASTPGMAANLARMLESLCAYRHLSPPGTPEANNNPVVYTHLKSKIGGRHYNIVSRIADAGFDYSNRSNKLAHHFAFAETRSLNFGPTSLLSTPQNFFTSWDSEAKKLSPRIPTVNAAPPHPCTTWQQTVGDAGIAADVIEAVQKRRQVYLIVNPDTPAMAMIHEALSLLPLDKQWAITFSTFFTKLPPSVACDIRCIMANSPEVGPARRSQSNLILDLTTPLPASTSKWADAARNGALIGQPAPKRGASSVTTDAAGSDVAAAANSIADQNSVGDAQGFTDVEYGVDLIDDDGNDYELAAPDLPRKSAPASRRSRGWNTLAPPELTGKKKKRSKLLWIGVPLLLLFVLVAGGGSYLFVPSVNGWVDQRIAKLYEAKEKPAGNIDNSATVNSETSSETQTEEKLTDEQIKEKMGNLKILIDDQLIEEARKSWDGLPGELKEREGFRDLENKISKMEADKKKQDQFSDRYGDLEKEIKSDALLDSGRDGELTRFKNEFAEVNFQEKHLELEKLLTSTRAERQKKRDDKLKKDLDGLDETFRKARGEKDTGNPSLTECKTLEEMLQPKLAAMNKLTEKPDETTDGLPRISETAIKEANKKIANAQDFMTKLGAKIAHLTELENKQLKSDEINLVRLRKHLDQFASNDKGTLFEVDRLVTSYNISFNVTKVERAHSLTDEVSIHILQDPEDENQWNIYDELRPNEKEIFARMRLVSCDKKTKTRLEISRVKDGDMHNASCRELVAESSLAIVCGDRQTTEIDLAPMTTTDESMTTNKEGEKTLLDGAVDTEIAQILRAKKIDMELVHPVNEVDLLNRTLAGNKPIVIQIKLKKQKGEFKTLIPETAHLNLLTKDKNLIAYWSFVGTCSETIVEGAKLKFRFDDYGKEKKPYTDIVKSEFFRNQNVKQSVEKELIKMSKNRDKLKANDPQREVIQQQINDALGKLEKLKQRIIHLQSHTGFPENLVIPLRITGGDREAILNLEIKKPD